MVIFSLMTALARSPPQGRSGGGAFGVYVATVVVTAGRADMMRALHFTAIAALGMSIALECEMRPAHVAAGFAGFLLRYCHFSVPEAFEFANF
jgi:hypothetical protein